MKFPKGWCDIVAKSLSKYIRFSRRSSIQIDRRSYMRSVQWEMLFNRRVNARRMARRGLQSWIIAKRISKSMAQRQAGKP